MTRNQADAGFRLADQLANRLLEAPSINCPDAAKMIVEIIL